MDYLFLAIAAGHWPLGVVARNYWRLVHPFRVVTLVLILSGLVCGLALIMTRLGVRRSTAVFTMFASTVLLTRAGSVIWRYEIFGWVLLLAVVGLAWYVGQRLGDTTVLEVVTVVLAVALGSGPVILAFETFPGMGASTFAADREVGAVSLTEKPDVFLIIVDGYPGRHVFDKEFDRPDMPVVTSLEELGFQVPNSVWSSYWSTELAVPTILSMSYPIASEQLNNGTRRDLYRSISGDNALMKVFESNGYETYMIESGWAGSSCGDALDTCISSPWLDDLVFLSMWESVVSPAVVGRVGHAYTLGTQHAMRSLERIAADDKGGSPKIVFAHLIAPHPPFFLNESCSTVVSDERLGDSFLRAGVDEQVRRGFFFEQAGCVDRFMVEFAASTSSDDVVVFVGDHGTDRKKYLLDAGEHDADAMRERLNVFMAARVAPDCDLGDAILTSNLMRRVLSCYAEAPLADIEERMFLPGYEMSEAEVSRLMDRPSIGS